MTCFNSGVNIVGITDKIIQNIFTIQFCEIQRCRFTLKFVIGCLKKYNIFVTVVYMLYRLKVILTEKDLYSVGCQLLGI